MRKEKQNCITRAGGRDCLPMARESQKAEREAVERPGQARPDCAGCFSGKGGYIPFRRSLERVET